MKKFVKEGRGNLVLAMGRHECFILYKMLKDRGGDVQSTQLCLDSYRNRIAKLKAAGKVI